MPQGDETGNQCFFGCRLPADPGNQQMCWAERKEMSAELLHKCAISCHHMILAVWATWATSWLTLVTERWKTIQRCGLHELRSSAGAELHWARGMMSWATCVTSWHEPAHLSSEQTCWLLPLHWQNRFCSNSLPVTIYRQRALPNTPPSDLQACKKYSTGNFSTAIPPWILSPLIQY